MGEEKKGFFARLKAGLTKTRTISSGASIPCLTVFQLSMKIFMKSWKRS